MIFVGTFSDGDRHNHILNTEVGNDLSNLKLFGNTGQAKHAAVKEKKPKGKRILTGVLAFLLVLEGLYYTAVYSSIPFIAKWRDVYIQTAMTTLSHQWLATAFIPQSIIDQSLAGMQETLYSQIGITSSWEDTEAEQQEIEAASPTLSEKEDLTEEELEELLEEELEAEQEEEEQASPREQFFEAFWEVDPDSLDAYLDTHPEALDDGWEGLYINEAGLDDNGTDIDTIYGDQILAIDVPNQILLIRITGSTYRGVMAVAKDASQLRIGASYSLGSYGQYAGEIAEQENAVLAINASGFIDPDGLGTGGTLAGYTAIQGYSFGQHMGWGYKRLELREDNLMYIVDAQSGISDNLTDAVEFMPALIVDGEILVDDTCGWTGMHPRSCIGQTANKDIMMLIVEGRMTSSLGVSVVDCAEVMRQYGCMQAMNQDGGSSAIMWYRGEYITKCSNGYTAGRTLPNAWVYGYSE
jgi:exopolysaccharide biosynthesis protein